jgi:hypothetical protein
VGPLASTVEIPAVSAGRADHRLVLPLSEDVKAFDAAVLPVLEWDVALPCLLASASNR